MSYRILIFKKYNILNRELKNEKSLKEEWIHNLNLNQKVFLRSTIDGIFIGVYHIQILFILSIYYTNTIIYFPKQIF